MKTDKLDFHIRGISGSWYNDEAGKGLETGLNRKHSVIIYKKVNTLYVGETYKISDLLYGGGYTFRNAEVEGADLSLSGWYAKGVNLVADNNDDSSWYNGLTQMSKKITMNEAGTYNITLTGSFAGYWLITDFEKFYSFEVVNKTPVVYQAFGETVNSLEVERWTDITLDTLADNQGQEVPAGYELGWEVNGKTYAAGSKYTVNGDGTQVVFNAVLRDTQKPVITVGDYTDAYYDGDELSLLPATISDNSQEDITASITVTKDGEAVEVTDNKVALSAGTYTITYTAQDSTGNEAETVVKTITVQGKVAVTYSDGNNTIATESYRPGEITLATFNSADVAEGYTFAGWKVGEEVYAAGETYTLGETPVMFVATFSAIEYTATLDYLEEGKANEVITFTIENRDEKLAEIKAKLPAANDGYGHSWQGLPNVLPLENVTYVEVAGAIVYTITFAGVEGIEPITFTAETKDSIVLPVLEEKAGYTCGWDKALSDIGFEDVTLTAVYEIITYTATVVVNGAETQVTYTIEDRETKLSDIIAMKPIADNEYYTYVWENPLPEELPLENGKTYTVIKKDVEAPTTSEDSEESEEPEQPTTSEEPTDSSVEASSSEEKKGGCSGSVSGVAFALLGAGILAGCLKKKEENSTELK